LDIRRHPSVALDCLWAASYTQTAFFQPRFFTFANGDALAFCIEPRGGAMAKPAEEHEQLVKVFDTDEESEAMVVRGLLESAGIEAMTQNREAPQDVLPGVGGVVVMVRPDQAEEALATIEAYRKSPTTDADEAVSEEPA
jgi:hypothetical protein